MDERQAVNAFAALAQESRLRIVRLLVQAGPGGLPAGAVAERIGASPSNMSFHLKELERAGLIQSRKASRQIIYSIAFPALSGLIEFLLRDCCDGHPEICGAIGAIAACCSPLPEVA